MAQLNDLLVLGKSCFGGAIKANSDHDLLSHSNEFNFISPGYSGDIYINYRTASGSDGNVSSYRFCNGQGATSANIYATTFYGALSGNATTATGFASAKTIALTGDVTGSVTGGNGSNGWSISTTVVDNSHNHSYLSGNENGYVEIDARLVVRGNGSSYNEGIRILPASNGWSNVFFSADTSLQGTHDGGWLIGRRGAAGSVAGAIGDFTIEEQDSSGTGLTIHKDNGGMTLRNGTFKILGTETDDGSGQLAIFKALSTQTSSSKAWVGRALVGAKNLTFLLGAYGGMAAIGAHSWSDSALGTGAAWAPIYIQPDGGANAAVYIGQNGSGWTKNTGTVEIKGSGTAQTGTVTINGTSRFKNRIYADEWIEFAGATGLYFPGNGCNGLHILPNQVGSYGPIRIMGTRGGYNGIHFGDDNQGLTVMSCEPHQGLYNENRGKWIIYYKRDVNLISIGNSTTRSNYINMGGNLYVEGNIHINNVGHGGISLYNDSSPNTYGIHMSTTGSYGTFGHVSSDWATYFCFDGDANRGWIFKHAGTNVFSINGSGTLSTKVNIPAINFRPDHDGYHTTASYQTGGNEALVFAAKNAVTSFIFVNGEDGVANTTSNRWFSLTPGLQIKNNCVTIGKLLANNTDPSYKLEVNGTSLFSGKMQVNAPIFGYNYTNNNSAAAFMWDKPSSHYTGVGANGDADTIYFGACLVDGTWETSYKQKWVFNGSVTADTVAGAIWNDYAEYRKQKENIKPGYCVISTDNGEIYKTTEKFQVCDGIVSDTFGFSIGETDECKTPLAVAGRVLAYCYGDKNDYHSGDIVCAGPEGKVYKMTREEIKEYPDRIIGHVSEIPNYEYWGTGNVKVDNRIWIKVK